MKLIAITAEKFIDNEAETINALFEAGLERLHLRKPHASANECERLILSIGSKWYGRISLHDHFGLAKKYGIGGLHLNSRNPQPPTGFAGILSRSCHSMEEAAREKHKYDYVFLSPIFDSISKNGYTAAFHRGALQAAARNGSIGDNVIALGGITPERIEEAAACGGGGFFCLVGGVLGVPNFGRLPNTPTRRPPPPPGPGGRAAHGADNSRQRLLRRSGHTSRHKNRNAARLLCCHCNNFHNRTKHIRGKIFTPRKCKNRYRTNKCGNGRHVSGSHKNRHGMQQGNCSRHSIVPEKTSCTQRRFRPRNGCHKRT